MKSKRHTSEITLHRLIAEFSYWGTTVRVGLIAFLTLVVLAATALNGSMVTITLGAALTFLYAVGSFLLLDTGYVIIARARQLLVPADKTFFFTVEAVLALLFLLPYIAVVPEELATFSAYLFVSVLAVLSLRLLLGVLYGRTK